MAVFLGLYHPGRSLSVAATQEGVRKLLEEVAEMHVEGSAVPQADYVAAHEGQQDNLDHFSKHGPQVTRQWSVLVPDSNILPPAMKDLAGVRDREILLYPVLDPTQQCGWSSEREVPLSLRHLLQQRIGHVSRSGPANCPSYILEMFTLLEAQSIQGKRGRTLVKHPGTSAYYARLRSNMVAMREWLGPPVWSITTCLNIHIPECLATWVRHCCSTMERPVEVWTREDEVRHLVLLTGAVEPVEGQGYFTHTRGSSEEEHDGETSNCPYHGGCWRQNLEKWRAR